MPDIAPELWEKIEKAIDSSYASNPKVRALLKKAADGSADYEDAHRLAQLVGEGTSKALLTYITAESLPDGKMYYNIADRTVRPALEKTYDTITDFTEIVQNSLNEQAGLGLKAVTPAMNDDRIVGLVNKLTDYDSFEDAKYLLGDPIVNFAQNVVDNSVKSNADFQYKSGLKSYIIRKQAGHCCDWCANLVGKYEYAAAPGEVFRRHQNCRCVTLFQPEKSKLQDVWTKKEYRTQRDAILAKTGKAPAAPKASNSVKKSCLANNVTYNKVDKLPKPLTEQEIIDRLGGPDKTGGSCSSLALAYIGNKNGFDVLDFRGGNSQDIFSRINNIKTIANLPNVTSYIEKTANDFTGAKKVLANVLPGKEYYLTTGSHAAIVRKNSAGIIEYLELQGSNTVNGFHALSERRLRDRFGCKKSHSAYGNKLQFENVLIEADSLKGNKEFEELLGFINTNAGAQKKGAGGHIK